MGQNVGNVMRNTTWNFPFLSSIISMMKSRRKKRDYNENIFKAIVASSVLTEEDSDLLSFHCKKFPRHLNQNQNEINRDLIICSSVVLCSGFALANVSMPEWTRLAAYLVPFGVFLVSLKRRLEQSKRKWLERTKHYIKVTDELLMLIKKCLRFIQEMEIASLGYTLACGRSTVSHLQRIQQSRTGKCLDLRYGVLNTCLGVITPHREASQKLLNNRPDGTKLNALLCQIPLHELGPCFEKDSSFEEICSSSDELCLQFLRDTALFMQLQQSEYLKLFVLSQHNSMEEKLLFSLMEELSILCEDQLKVLENVYHIQRNVSKPQHDGQGGAEGAARLLRTELLVMLAPGRGDVDTIFNIFGITPGDSKPLSLPSGTTSHRCNQLSYWYCSLWSDTDFESDPFLLYNEHTAHILVKQAAVTFAVQSEADFLGGEDISNISDVLIPHLLVHLEASSQCVSEALRCINKEVDAEPSQQPQNKPSPEIVNVTTSSVVDSSLLEKNDSYYEDQTFEAIVEESESVDDQEVSGIAESEENRSKRIEETRHVMRELKSVLHVKTSAEERELRKSKLFPDYIPKKITTENSVVVSGTVENCNSDAFDVNDTASNDVSDEKKFSADGEMHEILSVPRRAKIPRPNRRSRTRYVRAESDSDVAEVGHDSERESKHTNSLGFSSSLAHQAVTAAQALSGKPGWRMVEEATFGESDYDSS